MIDSIFLHWLRLLAAAMIDSEEEIPRLLAASFVFFASTDERSVDRIYQRRILFLELTPEDIFGGCPGFGCVCGVIERAFERCLHRHYLFPSEMD